MPENKPSSFSRWTNTVQVLAKNVPKSTMLYLEMEVSNINASFFSGCEENICNTKEFYPPAFHKKALFEGWLGVKEY
jgi:hypothetical protein